MNNLFLIIRGQILTVLKSESEKDGVFYRVQFSMDFRERVGYKTINVKTKIVNNIEDGYLWEIILQEL